MRSTTNDTSSIKGNVNFYNINPFTSPFHPAGEWNGVWPDPDDKPETDFNNCKPKSWNKEKCKEWYDNNEYFYLYDDHLWLNSTEIGGEMSLIRTKYFSEKLIDMDNFYGFFPRTYLP